MSRRVLEVGTLIHVLRNVSHCWVAQVAGVAVVLVVALHVVKLLVIVSLISYASRNSLVHHIGALESLLCRLSLDRVSYEATILSLHAVGNI